MKFKRIMSASMAAVMAVSSAIVCQISASAVAANMCTSDEVSLSKLTNVTKATVTVNVTATSSWGQVYCYCATNSDAGLDMSGTGEQSVDIDIDLSGYYFQIGYQGGDGIEVTLVSVVFKDASDNVVYTYDPNVVEESINKNNFTYSTLTNESMAIGDSFTITYDSTNTPSTAKYRMKYVYYVDSNEEYQYPLVVNEDGTLDNSSKDIVGVEVSETTDGTKTEYKFTAVSASKYPFKVNVEVSAGGEWNEDPTDIYLWFGEVSYKVLPASHDITVDSEITNGTVTADKETATADEEVTLTVKPATGYKLKSLKVLNGTDEVDVTDNKFTMPDGDVTVTAEFEAIVADSVSLNKTSTTLIVDGTETLVATVEPDDALDRTVTWKSSDTAVATVDETGKVTAKAAGTATITATTANDKTATCAVTVTDKTVAATGVTVKPTTLELEVDAAATLTGTVTPEDSTDKITWTSDKPEIATVDAATGKVIGIKEGTATITATAGEKTATCAVTVTPKTIPATGVTVTPTSKTLEIGESVALTGTVTPSDSTDKITWKSGNTAVATVDETGKVTAVKEGTATITATAGTKTAECAITVKAPLAEGMFEYDYDGSPIELTVGEASWVESGLAAQVNTPLTLKGVTLQTTTFAELKELYSGISLGDLAIENVPEGVNAEDINISIYIQGTGWSWNAVSGTAVEFSEFTGLKDTDVIMAIGFQINYNLPTGTTFAKGDVITLNTATEDEDEDEDVVTISPSNGVTQVAVKTDENGNVTERMAYFAISAKDAESCESFIVTITRTKDNKKLIHEVENCYKTVQYEDDGTHKINAASGSYCVLLDITNIGSDYGTITIKIEPKN